MVNTEIPKHPHGCLRFTMTLPPFLFFLFPKLFLALTKIWLRTCGSPVSMYLAAICGNQVIQENAITLNNPFLSNNDMLELSKLLLDEDPNVIHMSPCLAVNWNREAQGRPPVRPPQRNRLQAQKTRGTSPYPWKEGLKVEFSLKSTNAYQLFLETMST